MSIRSLPGSYCGASYSTIPVRDIELPSDSRPRDRRLQAGVETRLVAACREARNPHLLPIVRLALETAIISSLSCFLVILITAGR